MHVRILTKNDAEIYWQLRFRSIQEHPEAFVPTVEESLNQPIEEVRERIKPSPDSWIMGAFIDEKLVGIIGWYRANPKKFRHKSTIHGVYVASEARKKGIGPALMNGVIQEVSANKEIEQIHLAVAATNPARNLYLSFGFETYGYEKEAYKIDNRYIDKEHMVLFLPRDGMQNEERIFSNS